ncbi:hypothetical protein M378DRAFT_166634 [Amanita muscaria Koide BX008]|uniref:Uncharacterized protein n=1 Tax=Amanita muscaria (strain Koide BX008) TaxID=946122 RepID=A0A0C2SF33_AMAMK|nr:hypothetical protein M378DRAFT_166634 [Amanita muscaria Koide BX008]
MRFVITCLMSLLTLVASTPPTTPPRLDPQPPHPPPPGLLLPQPVGSFVNYVHEKSHHIGVVAGWDHGGHYNVVPIVDRQGQSEFLHEVVVKAHPYDVHHTGGVNRELGLSLAQNHRQNPPPFVARPTEPHPNSVHHIVKTYLAAGANGGHGGHGGTGGH